MKLQKYVNDSLSKVYFEINNSLTPFYGLHNLKLELGDTKSNLKVNLNFKNYAENFKDKVIKVDMV